MTGLRGSFGLGSAGFSAAARDGNIWGGMAWRCAGSLARLATKGRADHQD